MSDTPKCPCCERPMVAARDRYADGTWAARCFPCAQAGFDHKPSDHKEVK